MSYLKLTNSARLAWPSSTQNPAVSTSPVLGLQAPAAMLSFYVGAVGRSCIFLPSRQTLSPRRHLLSLEVAYSIILDTSSWPSHLTCPSLSFYVCSYNHWTTMGEKVPALSQETELRNISVAKEDQRGLISFISASPGPANLHQQQARCCPLKAPGCLLLGRGCCLCLFMDFKMSSQIGWLFPKGWPHTCKARPLL